MWAYLAIYVGLFGVLFGLAVRRFGTNGIWLAPACWVASEWVRCGAFGGFPWGTLGASQATVLPVVQLASVTGVHGLSLLVSLVSAAAAALAFGRRRSTTIGAMAVGVLLVAVAVGGTLRLAANVLTRTGTVTRIGLVQGNVSLLEKWDPQSRDAILSRYLALSQQAIGGGASIVFWPEASTPFYFDTEGALAEPVRRLAVQSRVPFIVGTDEYMRQERRGRSHLQHRGRRRRRRSIARDLSQDAVSTVRGVRTVEEAAVLRRSARAIRERLHGRHRAGRARRERSQSERRDLLRVDLSNDRSGVRPARQRVARDDHERRVVRALVGAVSALRHGRDPRGRGGAVRRARANTGISGRSIRGRVLLKTPLFEAASVTADVRLLNGRTIYGRFGDVVAWLSLAIAGAAAVGGLRSGPRR